MAQFKGDARDAKRARYGARVQEEMKEAFSRKVQEMRDETSKSLKSMELNDMFSTDQDLSQQTFTASIIGLQTHEQYKNKAKQYLNHNDNKDKNQLLNINKTKIIQKQPKTKSYQQTNILSFADDDDDSDDSDNEDDDLNPLLTSTTNPKKRKLNEITDDDNVNDNEPASKKLKIRKNPSVNTSFLPDADRDLTDFLLKKKLEIEWENKQSLIRQSRIEITYSYWDGSGHRRSIQIQKGTSIAQFLELVRKELSHNFSELRGTSGDNLMYIKDDLIIPQSYSFYDLIVTNAIGKSKCKMFKNIHYDQGDYTIDKDGGHPGKVITRAWYDRNKHIFPASRWEVYDPLQNQQNNK